MRLSYFFVLFNALCCCFHNLVATCIKEQRRTHKNKIAPTLASFLGYEEVEYDGNGDEKDQMMRYTFEEDALLNHYDHRHNQQQELKPRQQRRELVNISKSSTLSIPSSIISHHGEEDRSLVYNIINDIDSETKLISAISSFNKVNLASDIFLNHTIKVVKVISLFIDGNGFTLDGNHQVRVMNLVESQVILNNLTIANGNNQVSTYMCVFLNK
jgi:hypothetical protein